MWRVESGIEANASNVEEATIYMLVNVDKNGRELQRTGRFIRMSDASGVARTLNESNLHSAAVMANYLTINTYLESYVKEQDEAKQRLIDSCK